MSKITGKKQSSTRTNSESDPPSSDREPKATPPGPRDEAEVMFTPPSSTERYQELVGHAKELPDAELNKLLSEIRAEGRRREELRSASRPKVGSLVKIIGGGGKHVGKVGTAVIVRRSRCFVTMPDVSSPAYVLISDLELVPVS